MKIKWVDDIVAAFLGFPRGLRPLPEIYAAVERLRAEHNLALPPNWKSCIREKLQEHSSDCPHHWTDKRPDYFYSGGMRSGLWGLRNQYWPYELEPTVSSWKVWIPTPEDGYWRYHPGTLEQLALPETVQEFALLNEYVAVCNQKDPRVGIRVSLFEKAPT